MDAKKKEERMDLQARKAAIGTFNYWFAEFVNRQAVRSEYLEDLKARIEELWDCTISGDEIFAALQTAHPDWTEERLGAEECRLYGEQNAKEVSVIFALAKDKLKVMVETLRAEVKANTRE